MSSDLVALLGAIQALPPDVNPYRHQKMIASVGNAFFATIYASFALSSIGLLFGLLTIGAKIYLGSAWLFKLRTTSAGYLVTSNTALWLSIFTSFYFTINLVDMRFFLKAYKEKESPVAIQRIEGFMWFPIICCGISEAWGVATSSYLSRQNRVKRNVTGLPRFRIADKYTLIAINLAFPLLFLATATIMFSMFGIAGKYSKKTWQALVALKEHVEPAALAWKAGDQFVLDSIAIAKARNFGDEGSHLLYWQSTAYFGCVALLVVIILSFVPLAVSYLAMLSRHLQSQVESTGSRVRTEMIRVSEMRNAYRMMKAELILVSLLSVIFLVPSAWVAGSTEAVVSSARYTTACYGIALYAIPLFAIPLNAILAFRALHPLIISRQRKNFQAAVQIQTIVERFIECDDEYEEKVELPKQYRITQLPDQPAAVLSFDINGDGRGGDAIKEKFDI